MLVESKIRKTLELKRHFVKRLPNALFVFDKFHIVYHLLDAVDTVRKEEVRNLKSENPNLIKKSRYI